MDFLQLIRILWARKWIAVFCIATTVAAAIAVTYIVEPTFRARTTLILDIEEPDPVTGRLLPTSITTQYIQTEVDIIESNRLAYRVIDELNLVNIPAIQQEHLEETEGRVGIRRWLSGRLLGNLTVEPSRNSNLIAIIMEDPDPDFATLLANSWAQAYIRTNLDLRIQPATQTAAWFDEQIGTLRGSLEAARTRLSDYHQDSGVIATDERIDIETARLQRLSEQVVMAEAQTYDDMSRLRQMETARSQAGGLDALPEILGNGLIQNLKSQLVSLDASLAQLSNRVGRNHPEYRAALAERDKLNADIRAEIENVTRGIEKTAELSQKREDELRQSLEAQRARVLELKGHRDQIDVLVRDVEGYQRSFETAFQRYADAQLESRAAQNNIAVLAEAQRPLRAASPNLLLNVALALVAGTALGLGIAFLIEIMDRRVRSYVDLADASGAPVLGVLRKSGSYRKGDRASWFRRMRPPNGPHTPRLAGA